MRNEWSTGRRWRPDYEGESGAFPEPVTPRESRNFAQRPGRDGYGESPSYENAGASWRYGYGMEADDGGRVGGRDRGFARTRQYGPAYADDERHFGRETTLTSRETYRGRGPQGYRRTDPRIADEVHDRLTDDHHIDASQIRVEVKDGEVTLEGHVASRWAKHHAEHLVEDLPGVGHVQNNLRVDPDFERRQGAVTSEAAPLGQNSILAEQAAGKA